MQKKRNELIDVIRLFMAFLVVFIHTGQKSLGREFFLPIASCAVPFFFSVTGYYLNGKSIEKLQGQIKKLLSMAVCWMIFALLWDTFWILRNSGMAGLNHYLSMLGSAAVRMILFNVPMIGSADHLWYLLAMLYVLVLDCFLRKMGRKLEGTTRRIVIAALFVVGLLLGNYSFLWNGAPPYMYTRNFLFSAMPFYLIGQEIADWKHFEKKSSWCFLLLPSLLLLCVEYNWLEGVHLGRGADNLYNLDILTIPSVLLLWCFIRAHGGALAPNRLSKWGRSLSLGIYLIHPFVRTFTDKLFEFVNLFDIYTDLRPVIVFTISAIAIGFYKKVMEVFRQDEEIRKNQKCKT